MIDANFIQKILDIADVEVKEVDGRKLAAREMFIVKPPSLKRLCVSNLQGLIDYVEADIDGIADKFLYIYDPCNVSLISKADEIYLERKEIIQAVFDEQTNGLFNQFKEQEMFLLDLNTAFVRTGPLEQLIMIVSNVKSEDVRIDEDDGVSQTVTSRAGIAMVENVKLPNPVLLNPYRTFAEIDQPEDYFVFRARKARDGEAPKFGLFENGSGMWKIKAIDLIKEWLEERLPGIPIIG